MGLAFFDLKKSFDAVDHDILCKMFELYCARRKSWLRLGLIYLAASSSVLLGPVQTLSTFHRTSLYNLFSEMLRAFEHLV